MDIQRYAYQQEMRRRQQLIYRQLLQARFQRVAAHLRAGGSADDPDIRDDYQALVLEFGDGIFGMFTLEESKNAAIIREK